MGVGGRVRVLVVAFALVLVLPGQAGADTTVDAEDAEMDVAVTIEGRDTDDLDANAPLILEADEPLELAVDITNTGDEAVFVRSVRLRSTVIGLTFVAYETRVDMEVPPGESNERTFQLDLLDLRSQATGLLPANVELLDAERDQVASVPITVDVQGSYASVYGGFALAVAVITGLVLARNLLRLARGRLPVNRWTRAVHFGVPGLGVGLVATIGLSALRIFIPAPAVWGTLLVVLGAGFFVLGYLTPTPDRDEDFDDELDWEEEELATRARPTIGPDERPPTQRAAPPTIDEPPSQERE